MKPQPPVTKMRIASRTSSGRKAARADFSSCPPDAAQIIFNALESDWMFWGILGLAAVLRILFLGIKPPHFDEGINGWFVDQMVKDGFYRYDPTNYHGPLHFYILFLSQTLFGRNLYALRLPVVLASIGSVWLALKYDRLISRPVARLAALAMALSPGFVFYRRCSIPQAWPHLFSMMLIVCLTGIGVIVFFYSGTFFLWNGLKDLFRTFHAWFETGSSGHGHEKPWYYWLNLIARYEWPVCAGLILCAFSFLFQSLSLRFLA